MHFAVSCGHVSLVRELVDVHHANVHQRTKVQQLCCVLNPHVEGIEVRILFLYNHFFLYNALEVYLIQLARDFCGVMF